jgi:hypothetical protein
MLTGDGSGQPSIRKPHGRAPSPAPLRRSPSSSLRPRARHQALSSKTKRSRAAPRRFATLALRGGGATRRVAVAPGHAAITLDDGRGEEGCVRARSGRHPRPGPPRGRAKSPGRLRSRTRGDNASCCGPCLPLRASRRSVGSGLRVERPYSILCLDLLALCSRWPINGQGLVCNYSEALSSPISRLPRLKRCRVSGLC